MHDVGWTNEWGYASFFFLFPGAHSFLFFSADRFLFFLAWSVHLWATQVHLIRGIEPQAQVRRPTERDLGPRCLSSSVSWTSCKLEQSVAGSIDRKAQRGDVPISRQKANKNAW